MRSSIPIIIGTIAVWGLFFLIAPVACTDTASTQNVLEQQGYTNIEAGGYAYFECSQDDQYATRFTATAPNGSKVSGAVCGGFFKGNTPRFD